MGRQRFDETLTRPIGVAADALRRRYRDLAGYRQAATALMFRRRSLPLRITLLLWLVLIITALNVVRLATAIAWRGILASYMPFPGALYVAVTGTVWTLAGLFVLWSFWCGERRSRQILLGATLAYASWSWADRLFLQAGPRPNWLFALVVTILLLGYTAAVVLDPRNQSYFRKETYERKPEEPSSP